MNSIQMTLEEQYIDTLNKLELAIGDEEDQGFQRELIKRLDTLYEQMMGVNKLTLERKKVDIDEARMDLEERKFESEERKRQDDAVYKELEFKLKEREIDLKKEQLHQQKIDRAVNAATAVVTVGVPATCAWVWMKRGLKFEETGTYTARSGNVISSIQKLFGKK